MDRFAANTLRTLGIVLTSICVILGCLILLALAILFGAFAKAGGPGGSQASALVLGVLVAAAVLIAVGVFIIIILAKGIHAPSAPYPLIPPPTPKPTPPVSPTQEEPMPASDEARLDQALAAFETMARRSSPASPPSSSPPIAAAPAFAASSGALAAAHPVDLRHLSAPSRTAIQQLAYAIVAKVAAEVALALVGWFGALGVPRFVRIPFPVYRFGFVVWGLASIAPSLVLLYALARRPGPRAFAYALVIPSLHLLFGIFGHSAFLAFVLRAGQIATPLLSIFPSLLDMLILYLAWKAIRLTGVEPSPARLIVASVVIFLYMSSLPVLVLILNFWS